MQAGDELSGALQDAGDLRARENIVRVALVRPLPLGAMQCHTQSAGIGPCRTIVSKPCTCDNEGLRPNFAVIASSQLFSGRIGREGETRAECHACKDRGIKRTSEPSVD